MPFLQALCPLHRSLSLFALSSYHCSSTLCLPFPCQLTSPEPSLVEVVSRPGIQPLPPLPYHHHLGSGPLPLRIRAIGELLSCMVFIWELIWIPIAFLLHILGGGGGILASLRRKTCQASWILLFYGIKAIPVSELPTFLVHLSWNHFLS